MITEQALDEAIAECKGERDPNANTCVKLAAFMQLKDRLYPKMTEEPGTSAMPSNNYSYAYPDYESDTDFAKLVQDRNADEIIAVMDELMETLKILNPRLYEGVMRKLKK